MTFNTIVSLIYMSNCLTIDTKAVRQNLNNNVRVLLPDEQYFLEAMRRLDVERNLGCNQQRIQDSLTVTEEKFAIIGAELVYMAKLVNIVNNIGAITLH